MWDSATAALRVCSGLTTNSYACFHWAGSEKSYAGLTHADCIHLDAPLTTVAGCFGAISGSTPSEAALAELHGLGEPKCHVLKEFSYAMWIACGFGLMHGIGIIIKQRCHQSYPPWFCPNLRPVARGLCDLAFKDDLLATLMCTSEAFDMFSGTHLANNQTFLAQYTGISYSERHSHPVFYNDALAVFQSHMDSLEAQASHIDQYGPDVVQGW